MEELIKNTLGQLGAVGILIWFLYSLYGRMEKRLEQREKYFDEERAQLIEQYEAKIKSIVRDYREDALRHQADRDDWFESYFKQAESLNEILKAHSQAINNQNGLLQGCPHNLHPKKNPL